VARQKQKLRLFAELVGDVDISQLDHPSESAAMMSDYVAQLSLMPCGPSIAKARRETSNGPGTALVDWANKNQVTRMPVGMGSVPPGLALAGSQFQV
jgi:hypothetical protein